MKRYLVFLFASLALTTQAQNDSLSNAMRRRYEQFRQQAHRQYDDFRNEANRQYAEFMKEAWKRYEAKPAIPQPKDENIPPVVMPEEDKDKPVESTPVTIEEVVTPTAPLPQPLPVTPIREQPQPEEHYVEFRFFGTGCKVRFNDEEKFSLANCSSSALASAWEKLSGKEYNNTIRDCLELRTRMNLCDWAYLNMLSTMSESFLGQTNEAVLLMAFVYCQSGYKMRLGTTGNRLFLLYASEYSIYGQPYFSIEGENYYPFHTEEAQMNICDASFPKERSLSLEMPQTPSLTYTKSTKRKLQAKRYPDVTAQVSVNKNLIDFYDTYPTSEIGGNFMTRWAMYANTPLEKEAREELYPALREKIKGLDEKEAVERLLNFVQTAFVYEFDDKVWGHDRAFFAEETLYYPYCDCEDRSILFTRLIRDLLGLKVILVYYPGHLATAVCFTDGVEGDYISLNGKRFVVCDPTFIGAPVGHTMTGMDNQAAKVILLE